MPGEREHGAQRRAQSEGSRPWMAATILVSARAVNQVGRLRAAFCVMAGRQGESEDRFGAGCLRQC